MPVKSVPATQDSDSNTLKERLLPEEWRRGASLARTRFSAGIEPDFVHQGRSVACIEVVEGKEHGYVWLSRSLEFAQYVGMRIKVNGFVKAEDVVADANVFFTVFTGTKSYKTQGLTPRLRGTKDWSRFEFEADIPAETTDLRIGGTVAGTGTIWFTELEIDEVGTASPTKASKSKPKAKATKPVQETWHRPLSAIPRGWWSDGSQGKGRVGIDQEITLEGEKVACIEHSDCPAHAEVWLWNDIDASGYIGKRVKLTAYLKSEAVTGTATIGLRMKSANNGCAGLDEMDNRPIKGTTDWTKCETVMDVPPDTVHIRIGARLQGSGIMWVGGLSFEEVGGDVPVTDNYAMGCRGVWPNQPLNLDFAEDEDPRFLEPGQPTIPKTWLSWSSSNLHEILIDEDVVRTKSGRSVTIKSKGRCTEHDTGEFFQKFGAPEYRGKRVRFSAYTKTADIAGYCGLVVDLLDPWQQMIVRENTYDLDSAKSLDWVKREIVVDVPHRIGVILIGATLGGTGQMWIDSVSFEEVGLDVPLTHSLWQETPRNLDFEE